MTQSAWRKYTEWPLVVAALIFLIAYSVEVIGNLRDEQSVILEWIIWATWALFIIDYVVNLILAERRMRWFFRNLHEVAILALPMLRPLRLIRLLVLLRQMHRLAGNTLRERVLAYVLGSAVVLTYVAALAVLDAEQNAPGSNIRSIGNAMWWAVTTITTVGYGDYHPVTLIGRLVAVGLMIGGIAVLGVVTATIASWLVERVGSRAAQITHEAEDDTRAELARVTDQLDRLTALVERGLVERGVSVDHDWEA